MARAIVVQDDDKIVIAGDTEPDIDSSGFAVVHFDPDGSLDDSVGGGRKVTTNLGR